MKLKVTLGFLGLMFSSIYTFAGEKITVEEAKISFHKLCGSHAACNINVDKLTNNSSCDELRQFLYDHGMKVSDGRDVSEVVFCK